MKRSNGGVARGKRQARPCHLQLRRQHVTLTRLRPMCDSSNAARSNAADTAGVILEDLDLVEKVVRVFVSEKTERAANGVSGLL